MIFLIYFAFPNARAKRSNYPWPEEELHRQLMIRDQEFKKILEKMVI